MGNLTNQYVSQSYQGLLKLDNSNTGVTATLQYVTDGLGNKIPMQVSTSSVVITGSFRGDGSGLTGITANVDSSSLVTTSSFNSYTSSNDNRVNSLINATGSYATTSSLTALSQSIASTDLAQNNRLTSIEGVTGSFASTSSLNSYTLTSSFNAYTSSTNGRLNSLESATGSLQNQINQKLDTGSFNAYTSSNDGKVNSLIAATASYVTETESGSFLITGSASGNVLTFTKGNGTQFNLSVDTGSNSNRDGLITTASAGVLQTILGSLQVNGTVFATSASFTYLNTIYETASVIYSSGSNQFGDASNDTQTLWGTVVLPSGPLVITGSVTASAGFNGNLQGTASFASNALSASQAQNAVSASQSQNSVSASQAQNANTASYVLNAVSSSFSNFAVSSSQSQNAVSASQADNAVSASQAQNAVSASYANDINRTGLITTGSAASTQSITGSLILSGSAGPELDIKGDVIVTGSVILSGSAGIELDVKGDTTITGSLYEKGNLFVLSNNTTVSPDLYLTSSQAGQSNTIFGWSDNPTGGGPGAVQANYTGSLRITGSNNIVSLPQLRASSFLAAWSGYAGYISGSHNWINGNNAGIYMATGSQLLPKTQGNLVGFGSSIGLGFTSSSLGNPTVQNNNLNSGQLNLVHNSGSAILAINLANGGGISSTQNFVTNTTPSITTNFILGNTVTLNHLSSSITYNNNINIGAVTINNALSSSGIANNNLLVQNNTFLGGQAGTHTIFVSGSQSTNATRNIVSNLIGGTSINISSSIVSSSNAVLSSTIAYGNNLHVSASHTVGTSGGSAFFGRFNDTGSLALAQDIVFAVGTGTAVATRRTGLYVTSGSLVGISGSLDVKGNTTLTGSLFVQSGSAFPLQTGSALLSYDFGTGQIAHTTYASALPALMAAGAFYDTGSYTTTANVSASFVYFSSVGVNDTITVVSGSRLTVPRTATYNIQYSTQISQGSGEGVIAVWLKKDGVNVADTATYVTVPSNHKEVLALNIWDNATSGSYYELAYQSDSNNTTFQTVTASGNIPRSPSIIVTVNQVR